jgi:hypothetical protein
MRVSEKREMLDSQIFRRLIDKRKATGGLRRIVIQCSWSGEGCIFLGGRERLFSLYYRIHLGFREYFLNQKVMGASFMMYGKSR